MFVGCVAVCISFYYSPLPLPPPPHQNRACKNKQLEILRLLLLQSSLNPDLAAPHFSRQTGLMTCLEFEFPDGARLILEDEVPREGGREGGQGTRGGGREGGREGGLERVNVNATEIILLNTPLHLAASLGEAGVVGLLLQKGADLTLVNRKGERPVDRYVRRREGGREGGRDVYSVNSPCTWRLAWGREQGREGGADAAEGGGPDACQQEGGETRGSISVFPPSLPPSLPSVNTLLHLAASLGEGGREGGVVERLLQKWADLTLVNRKGERPVDR